MQGDFLQSNSTKTEANNINLTSQKPDMSLEILTRKMDMLNSTTQELLKYMKDTADNTKRTHDATKALNGNLFA